ncbi:hypothetical protein QP411_04830 [Pseudoglutamicibacter cumminsii]|uniref:hypothetical protein n=1 Tax=Pseudoglutamicibacter cumminsii TaxID=156979 RepID=UPI002552297C|nr:hypothetical protein [Pseudoglutamicibacter cumminsii]MDK7083236.1 hypothetical protein [Pseudoglutamicibacter cumminsii]
MATFSGNDDDGAGSGDSTGNSAGGAGSGSGTGSGSGRGIGGFPEMSMGTLRNAPPTAYLRVYSPFSSFDDAEQSLIATPGHALDAPFYEEAALWRSLARISRPRVDPFPHGTVEQYRTIVLDRDHGDVVMFCPAQEPLRAGIAASLLEDYAPEEVLDVWFPPAAAEAHSERLQEHGMWLADSPLFTRMSTWRVPLSWFTLFRPGDEEEVVTVDDSQPFTASVRVPLVLARQRASYAVEALSSLSMIMSDESDAGGFDDDSKLAGLFGASGVDDDGSEPGGMLASVVELHDWLGQFHPDSMVELDYGLLTARAWPDDSALDVADGLDALLDEDVSSAVSAYFRLRRRWDSISMWAHAG